MTARKWLFGLLFLIGAWLTPYAPEQARATTVVANVCAGAPNLDCAIQVDAGIRANLVGVLGFNRYTVLPFAFSDAAVTLTGTALAADLLIGGSNFIYLYATGIATQSVLGLNFYLNAGISQTYATLGGIGTFGAHNIGACNLAGVVGGDGAVMQPFVNGVGLGGGIGTTACSPFAQFYPAQNRFVGGLTNLAAVDAMQFNGGVFGAQITLPWGDSLPDPSATTLNSYLQSDGDSIPTIIGDLQALDPGITQQFAPEPATLAVLGSGLFGLAALRRKRRS